MSPGSQILALTAKKATPNKVTINIGNNVERMKFMESKKAKLKEVGIRPGEKLHEQMIGVEDSFHTYEYQNYFKM